MGGRQPRKRKKDRVNELRTYALLVCTVLQGLINLAELINLFR